MGAIIRMRALLPAYVREAPKAIDEVIDSETG